MTNSKPKRRWYQFSMRTLLVVMLVFCLGVGWAGARMQRAQENRERVAAVVTAVTEIEKLGGMISSGYEDSATHQDLRPQTWLETLFDDPGSRDDPVGVLEVMEVSFAFTDDITDAGLEHLKGMTKLTILDLREARVTNAGLEHLKDLPKLYFLSLGDTRVTDAGLEYVKGLTNLRTLNLRGTQVTDEGVKKLQRALPNCKITH